MVFMWIPGWTGDGCEIPDCGYGACYIDEGRGYCDGSTGAPICVCNVENVSTEYSLFMEPVFMYWSVKFCVI